jgi:hypothetical protein
VEKEPHIFEHCRYLVCKPVLASELLMTEPAGDAEVFAGGLDEVGGGSNSCFNTSQLDLLNLIFI